MEGVYVIRRMPEDAGALALTGEFDRGAIPYPYLPLREAAIAHYEWGNTYTPPAFARVGWNAAGLHVLMYALEARIRADEKVFSGRVCEDSCLEFFVMPKPAGDSRYVNIEVNAAGTGHIGIGAGRHARFKLTSAPPDFDIHSSEHAGGWWAVSYTLGAAFLREHFGDCLKPGAEMRGNFYKCDESIHPHFGTCFPVKAEKPDFHRPEFFGKLLLI